MHDLSTTLVAVATASGRAGVGCVRLSGPRAHEVAATLFRGKGPAAPRDGGAPRFGTFLDASGRPIDHGFLVAFPPARAFTGEPTVELWTHGSPPVLAALVEAAFRGGALAAGPGEFTYRSLRNGRVDLARAEAIGDLVAARTLHQARVAFSQVEGAIARRLAPLRELLIDLVARGEAAIEFAEEAEVDLPAGRLIEAAGGAAAIARELLAEARRGRIVRDGMRVAIVGATSVGKSSIFNRLLGTERAIVSATPGTTRDTLEEAIDFHGVAVSLVDTAGLRDADEPVEAEGVRRARAAAAEADVIVLVLDGSRELLAVEAERLDLHRGDGAAPLVVVANKSDLRIQRATPPGADVLPISALTGAGWDRFREALGKAVAGEVPSESPALTNARHRLVLEGVLESVGYAEAAARRGLSDEVVLVELRDALDKLGQITGEVATDDLYDKIFSTFCIGK